MRTDPAMLAPSWGAAKMMASTRWAIMNSMTGPMSTVSVLVDLLEQDAVAGRLRLLGDAVEGLGDPEVAQAGDDDPERLRATLHEASRDGARLEPGRGDGRLHRQAGLGRHVGRSLMTRETVWVETPHMRAISRMVMPCPDRARVAIAVSGRTCHGVVG